MAMSDEVNQAGYILAELTTSIINTAQVNGCQKRAALGGHCLMLEGGTHGTLLCSGGNFEAIS